MGSGRHLEWVFPYLVGISLVCWQQGKELTLVNEVYTDQGSQFLIV